MQRRTSIPKPLISPVSVGGPQVVVPHTKNPLSGSFASSKRSSYVQKAPVNPLRSSANLPQRSSSKIFAQSMENFVKETLAKRSENRTSKAEISGEEHRVTVRIRSIYGECNFVTCSAIDVLGLDKTPIPVTSIRYESTRKTSPELLKLVDGKLIKVEESAIWTHTWPPDPSLNSLDISITVRSEEAPASLRIWPNQLTRDGNVKEVEIYLEDVGVYDGEIPIDFGQIIPLKPPETNIDLRELIHKTKVVTEKPVPKDTHGNYFDVEFETIEFNILESWGSTTKFGLSMIKLYDIFGSVVDIVKEEGSYKVENCGLCTSTAELFNIEPGTGLWQGEYIPGKQPKVSLTFESRMKIAAIEIINAEPNDCAVRKMIVRMDDRTIWSGRLRDSCGDAKPRSTFIMMIEDEELCQKIKSVK